MYILVCHPVVGGIKYTCMHVVKIINVHLFTVVLCVYIIAIIMYLAMVQCAVAMA